MWSYNARERRPAPPESAESSYDGKERLVRRNLVPQDNRRQPGVSATKPSTTNAAPRPREEQGS